MKKLDVFVKDVRGDLTLTINLGKDWNNEEIFKNKDKFVNLILKSYPKATLIELLIPTKSQINEDRLMRIGDEMASLWGGKCLKAITYENLVRFNCIEYGEKFDTYMTYKEIEEEYNYIK